MFAYSFQDENCELKSLVVPEDQLASEDVLRYGVVASETLPDLAANAARSGLPVDNHGLVVLEIAGQGLTIYEDSGGAFVALEGNAPTEGDTGQVLVIATDAHWAAAETSASFLEVVGVLADMYNGGQSFEAIRDVAWRLIR